MLVAIWWPNRNKHQTTDDFSWQSPGEAIEGHQTPKGFKSLQEGNKGKQATASSQLVCGSMRWLLDYHTVNSVRSAATNASG